MSEDKKDVAPVAVESVSKKRKRTGKQREEAKRAAIQAKLDAEKEASDARNLDAEESTEATGVTEIPADVTAKPVEGVDIELLAKRIPQALKHLHPTFKQAKMFEVRRLLKKIKFLRQREDVKDLADLEAQHALLTHINIDSVIKSHLLVKLAKNHHFKHTSLPPNITSLLSTATPASSSAADVLRGRVENRLCSAKIVADGVRIVMSWLTGEKGAKLIKGKPTKSEPKAGMNSRLQVDAELSDDDEDEDGELDISIAVPEPARAGDESDEDEDVAAEEAGWESGSVSGSLDGSHDDGPVLASPSSGEVSDGDDGEPAVPAKRSKLSKPSKTTKAAKAAKAQPAQQQARPSKQAKIVAPSGPVTGSAFLPALSNGFVMGDSDSDPDEDPDVEGAGLVGRQGVVDRKNRRGQRARQMIWEKKYGSGAKHVVKAKEQEATAKREGKFGKSDSGWGGKGGEGGEGGSYAPGSATRGRVGGRGGSAGRGGRGGRGGAAGGRGGFSGAPASTPAAPAASGKDLHPSWEAARLRKQKEAAGAGAPKATKITFD